MKGHLRPAARAAHNFHRLARAPMGALLSTAWRAVAGPPELPDVVLVPPLLKAAGVSGRSVCAPAARPRCCALVARVGGRCVRAARGAGARLLRCARAGLPRVRNAGDLTTVAQLRAADARARRRSATKSGYVTAFRPAALKGLMRDYLAEGGTVGKGSASERAALPLSGCAAAARAPAPRLAR
jgi:hypothetical protein